MGTHGRFLPGTFFAHFFKEHEHTVRQFQIIQEERDKILIKVIKGKRFELEAYNILLNDLRHFMGNDMIIHTEFVENIPLVRTGKHTATISKLNIDFQRLPNRDNEN
jgi:phenylacetate-CoA ligase